MKTIPLGHDRFALVDDDDYRYLKNWTWHFWECPSSTGARTNSRLHFGRRYGIYMHRLIMRAPRGVEVDHVNGNQLDNRRSNLRFATRLQNCQNRKARKDRGSRFKGLHWRKDKSTWRVRINHAGRRVHVGDFTSEEEAARAYDAKAREFHGQFARLNFPN